MRLKSFTELAQHLKPYISVTDHAVDQYRNRLMQWYGRNEPDDVLRCELARIVEKGKVTRALPGGLREYTYNGLSVAVDDRRTGQTVVTFLGDILWKEWWKQQTKKKFSRKVVV
ncbi:hypothetical protein IT084_02630 [Desulfallas sp. Bu1-1]|uniref:hypothetical protein n=1 Tax=Desulfallas sp. Bu1-1 TaxID=2787620 RepID=UPI00189E30AF|nr:hypothetical protein [Desulfallas sp. Bu1-1]MBF7081870.1 hypothetical protein [Desulfallas sp. Bu1-1]